MSYVSRYELRCAYEDCMRKKHNTENAILFEVDDNVKLENLYVELNTMQYKIGKSIVFVLNNNKGIPYREVFAADFKDRIVHHLLINRLLPTIEKEGFIDDSYACRTGKGVLFGVKRLQEKLKIISNNGKLNNVFIIKGDFKNCFNSINKHMLYKKMEGFIVNNMFNDKNLIFNLYLLKLIIYHRPNADGNYIRKQGADKWIGLKPEKSMFNLDELHGIAIGNLTSQIFVNFFLSIFDKYVTQILNCKYYGRYVDDFYIIGYDKNELIYKYKLLCEFVKTLELTINTNKFYVQNYKRGINFIGYCVHYNRIYLIKTTRYKIIRMMYNAEKKIPNVNMNKLIPTWNSYMGMLSHTNCYNFKNEMKSKFNKLFFFLKQNYNIDECLMIKKKKVGNHFPPNETI